MDDSKTVELYEVLDRAGVASLAKALLAVVNARINERIVTEVDENSDNNHVASALAVYNAIVKNSHIDMKTITGRIEEIQNPSPTTIYLQRDDEEDTTWMMYVHTEDEGWISIGSTEIDLSNYWSKDDTDALKEVLGLTGINTDIADLRSELDKKVDKSQMYALTETEIQAIIAQADEKTANQMVKVGNVVYSDMAAAIANCEPGGTVQLTKDIAIQKQLVANNNMTIDLNGNTLKVDNNVKYGVVTSSAEITIKNGSMECSVNNRGVRAKGTGKVKLENVKMSGVGTELLYIENDASVVVDKDCVLKGKDYVPVILFDSCSVDVAGTIEVENFYAIGGNGSYGIDTTMTIREGAKIVKKGAVGPAIYHPGKGTLNIEGGEIISDSTGVELRAGTLNVTGGVIKANQANLEEVTCNPNGSGTTTEGAAIAIVQHTTKYPMTVNITGGTIESNLAAVFERNVHTNLPAPVLNLGISGEAEVVGPVSVENAANFISGGTFTQKPNDAYLVNGKRFVEGEGKYTVQDA